MSFSCNGRVVGLLMRVILLFSIKGLQSCSLSYLSTPVILNSKRTGSYYRTVRCLLGTRYQHGVASRAPYARVSMSPCQGYTSSSCLSRSCQASRSTRHNRCYFQDCRRSYTRYMMGRAWSMRA